MKIPSLEQAHELLAEAGQRNPGPWVQHSINVAQGARLIAERHPALDPTAAYICGLLHDIGRREGVTDLRHVLDGYHYLSRLGYADAARICLTHSFPVPDIRIGTGQWDCTAEEYRFIEQFLTEAAAADAYTLYDQLIQLCDALALPGGFCLMEKRLIDVALRRGVNEFAVRKWQAFFDIQRAFEAAIGCSIYALLPGVVPNTFGFDPAG